ncbi:hypothetical protein OIY81_2679 [Cryptosporidium canis]|uniref:Dilute domain-containing protein n=1 Tax=Cryptosporidium canis TaxID=195482 RepID=A0ABQ8PCJ6_9CRYT|nr:hypothetical protein OIY81_2679 [Cryptosporidium canis]KAJ1615388.1 hypothetical protein OJ252_179 [Cryptosporidium canis]
MSDISRFQGLSAPQIHEELLKCPKSSWPKIISELPSGIKSELVAILSNKRASSSQGSSQSKSESAKEATLKKPKLESSNQVPQESSPEKTPTPIIHPKCIPLETEAGTEGEMSEEVNSKLPYPHINKVFQQLMVSTFSPIGSIVSRTMYIAGDVRPFLKNKDCQEISVRLVQSYLNLWISLFWNSLINNSSKKKISNKLTNNIIKKHLSEYYKQEVRKFDYDTLVNKSAHRHAGVNTNSENEVIQVTDAELSAIPSSVKVDEEGLHQLEESEVIDYDSNIPSNLTIGIDKRFEDRLRMRDIRTKNMSPETYKEFAMLREKNFRPSVNTLQEWLSITWNTAYNNGLKDTKVSQIPSNSIQLFSFILNDIISSLVENALRISYMKNSMSNRETAAKTMNYSTYESLSNCKDLIDVVKEQKESLFDQQGEHLDLKTVDFNLIIDTFSKSEDEVPELNYVYYIMAMVQRLNEIDIKLIDTTESSRSSLSNSKIDLDSFIEKIHSLNSKLTANIIRGQQNSCGGSVIELNEKRKRDSSDPSLDIERCTNSEGFGGADDNDYMGNEEDDMFEAIVESATGEFPITSAFPNGIPDEISIYCYLRMKKVIRESKDPEDFSKVS